MATTADEIFDLFLASVEDYRLNNIYQTSGSSAFTTYMEPWLIKATVDFSNCTEDLTYDTSTQSFSVDLSTEVKVILSELVGKYWLEKQVNDIRQMNLSIQDHDFKHYAESQNLREKRELLDNKVERVSQMILKYGLKNNDWASWNLQEF